MGIKLSKVAKAAKKYDHILIIMRHAKAEPFGDKGDSERELTDKGLKQAKAVGKGIESTGARPNLLLVRYPHAPDVGPHAQDLWRQANRRLPHQPV